VSLIKKSRKYNSKKSLLIPAKMAKEISYD